MATALQPVSFGVTANDPFGFVSQWPSVLKITSISKTATLDPVIVAGQDGEYVTKSQKSVNKKYNLTANYQAAGLGYHNNFTFKAGLAKPFAIDSVTFSTRAGQHMTIAVNGHQHEGGSRENHNATARSIQLPRMCAFGAQTFGLSVGVPEAAIQSGTLQINFGHTDDPDANGNFLCGTTHGVSATITLEAIDPTKWADVAGWIKTNVSDDVQGEQSNSSHQSRTVTYTKYFDGPSSGGSTVSIRAARARKPKEIEVSRIYHCTLMDPEELDGAQVAAAVSSLSGFASVSGAPGAEQILYVEGEELEEALTVSCPTGYEASADGSEWTDELEIEPENGEVIANVRIRLAASASAGNSASATVSGNVTVSCGDAEDVTVAVSGTVAHAPTVTVTGTLSAFSTTAGTASTAQTLTLAGTYLTGGVEVSAPYGLEVSKDGEIYAGSVSLAQTSGSVSGTVYVRVASYAEVGTIAGNVEFGSEGAATATAAATATVAYKPTVAASGTAALETFTATAGTESEPKAVTISGEHLAANLVATVTGDFEVCKTADGTYGSSASVSPDADNSASFTLYVRVSDAAEEGDETGTLTVSSTGADSKEYELAATVEAAE